jgi:hypothetical protein
MDFTSLVEHAHPPNKKGINASNFNTQEQAKRKFISISDAADIC